MHETVIVPSAHWRDGAQYYARCACGWVSRRYVVRVLAVDAADLHTRSMAPAPIKVV
jgi:hypothetical protein